ncbi:MAG: hypothetical protein KAU50_05820 [Candidatus Marinimicrobia bacterium]|nr:hypothetical protein [Candidatus Neomarinimicrobiota bacterium]
MGTSVKDFFQIYWRSLAVVALIAAVIIIGLYLHVDAKLVALFAVIAGFITNGFVALATLTSLVPVVGPILVKLFSLPVFYLFNALGGMVSFVAVKKGYTGEMIHSRLLTIMLLIGVAVGYILGNLLPIH